MPSKFSPQAPMGPRGPKPPVAPQAPGPDMGVVDSAKAKAKALRNRKPKGLPQEGY